MERDLFCHIALINETVEKTNDGTKAINDMFHSKYKNILTSERTVVHPIKELRYIHRVDSTPNKLHILILTSKLLKRFKTMTVNTIKVTK